MNLQLTFSDVSQEKHHRAAYAEQESYITLAILYKLRQQLYRDRFVENALRKRLLAL